MVEKEGRIEQVNADDAQRFLLEGIFFVEHPHVQDDLVVGVPRKGLIAHAHPPVTLIRSFKIQGRDGIGKGKECGCVTAGSTQPFDIQAMLIIEHPLEALSRDIALAAAIDGIADGHVVRGNRL